VLGRVDDGLWAAAVRQAVRSGGLRRSGSALRTRTGAVNHGVYLIEGKAQVSLLSNPDHGDGSASCYCAVLVARTTRNVRSASDLVAGMLVS